MKKLIMAVAIVCVAAISQAASVGWTVMNADAAFRGGDYSFFVIGKNGVESASQIATIVAAQGLGGVDSYALFTGGEVTAAGAASRLVSATPAVTITYGGSGTETYSAFLILQSADGTKATYTSTVSVSLANNTDGKTFAFANQATATANNSFTVNTPEPTSGVLLLLGMAGLALKRKRA